MSSILQSLRDAFKVRGRRTRAQREATRVALKIEVTEIASRKFVSGLHWQPLSSALKYKKEAKSIAADKGWDVVAYRHGLSKGTNWIQAGFVSTSDGAYKTMYSFAAALAGELRKEHGDRWLGLFAVGHDQYLFVGVWDGNILPASDRIVSRERASAVFSEQFNLYNTDGEVGFVEKCLFAPRELDLGGTELDVFSILGGKKLRSEYQLKALTFSFTAADYRKAAAFAAILFALWEANSIWKSQQEEKARAIAHAQQMARDAALAEANANARKRLLLSSLVHPWAVLPAAKDFVNECETTIANFPLSIAGWDLSEATCKDSALTVIYKRGTGTSQVDFGGSAGPSLMDVALSEARPVLAFTDSGEAATITVGLKVPVAGDDVLDSQYGATSGLLAVLESANSETLEVISKLNIKELATQVKAAAPVGASDPPAPEATWRRYGFAFDSIIRPQAIFDSIEKTTGLRVSSIHTTFDAANTQLNWTLTGDLYVQK
jgi:hypothetical protein